MTWLISDIPIKVAVGDLIVRRYLPSDAALLGDAIAASLPELIEWMPWAKFEPQTVLQRETLINLWSQEWKDKTNFTMGVFRDGSCVGGTGLHLRGDIGELEIGYWVSSAHTKQGIATRVSEALVNIAFGLPEVVTVTISHDIANIASQRIPERLGFVVVKQYQRKAEAANETGVVKVWGITKDLWRTR